MFDFTDPIIVGCLSTLVGYALGYLVFNDSETNQALQDERDRHNSTKHSLASVQDALDSLIERIEREDDSLIERKEREDQDEVLDEVLKEVLEEVLEEEPDSAPIVEEVYRRPHEKPHKILRGSQQQISRQVRQEANWTCQRCSVNLSSFPHLLHCHHKDGNYMNNSSNNLIALCALCHQKEHSHNIFKKMNYEESYARKIINSLSVRRGYCL